MTTKERSSARRALTPSATMLEGVDVEARIGLVEDRQPRFEHGHVEDLVALLLATREALVDRPLEQACSSSLTSFGLFAHQLEEVHGVELFLAAVGSRIAFSAARRK
jgi:hypothetical protein